jgi:hypothetical protein
MIRTAFAFAAAAVMAFSAIAGTVVVMDAPAPVTQVA